MMKSEAQIFTENFVSKFYNFPNKEEYTITEPVNIIVRPECNQKCAYCYIAQYGDKLYPKEERVGKDIILKNLQLFLNWLIDNKIAPIDFSLFAGDMFNDHLFYEILDVFLDTYSNLEKYPKPIRMIIPINGYFLQFKEHQDLIQKYLDKCQANDIFFQFSISTDGLYAINSRENMTYNLDQTYYDKLFSFLSTIPVEMHPMISAENIAYQKENLNWWIKMFDKYKLSGFDTMKYPSFLEVRNPNWTEKDLEQFSDFLQYFLNKRLELKDNSIEELTKTLFCPPYYDKFYDICRLLWKPADNKITCAMPTNFSINLATLALPLCHRLTYPQFNLGNFIVENNKITGINPSLNYSTHVQIKTIQPKFYPRCNSCYYKDFCIKGCLGAQYEFSGEILMPIPCVCVLEQTKVNTLLTSYNELGILDCALENNYIYDKNFENFIINYKTKNI